MVVVTFVHPILYWTSTILELALLFARITPLNYFALITSRNCMWATKPIKEELKAKEAKVMVET